MTWVWKYNEKSRLQIGASSNCANISGHATFHARKNSPSTRPWSAQFCSTAVKRGCWPKGRRKVLRTICSPIIENGVYRRRYNHELDREFDSPKALNFMKTSRLCYAGHIIRRPQDLPKKALFRAKPNERRNQRKQKYRWADGVNSDSLALGVRDWTHCAQDRQTWRDLLQQALTRYWL
jgi:hypothetical protein